MVAPKSEKVVKEFTMRMVTGWTQWESLAANRRSLERPRAGRGTIRKAPRKYKNLFRGSKKIRLSRSNYMVKKKSGWREWRHKRKWERKREEEDAESLFVSTKDQLQWWPGFSKIEGNRFCYWTWKKHLHSISLYSFSPNWKNMLFLLSCGVGGCQRRGVIWAVGGIEMAPAIFSTKDTEHDNRSYRPPRCCYWEYS